MMRYRIHVVENQNRESQTAAKRKLFVWAKHFKLSDDDRIEFAQYLLRRDITSWKQLDEDQVYRLLDAFEGHHLLSVLAEQGGPDV